VAAGAGQAGPQSLTLRGVSGGSSFFNVISVLLLLPRKICDDKDFLDSAEDQIKAKSNWKILVRWIPHMIHEGKAARPTLPWP
jgi:hypothetical protein